MCVCVCSVARSFGKLQPSVLYGENEKHSMQLVRLAKLLLNVDMRITEFSQEKWQKLRKGSTFNEEFNSYTDQQIGDLVYALEDEEYLDEASQFMNKVRTQLKFWLKHDGPPSTIGQGNSINF